MRRSRGLRCAGAIAAVAALALSFLVFALSTPADSAVVNSFGVRFQTNDNGAISLFGNTVLTCPAAAPNCADALNGTGPSQNNNNFTMTYVDADRNAFPTYNSSRSTVSLPTGSTVLWAGLYWGAKLGAGTGGVSASATGRVATSGPTPSRAQSARCRRARPRGSL